MMEIFVENTYYGVLLFYAILCWGFLCFLCNY